MAFIGRRRGELGHFLIQPRLAGGRLELRLEVDIDVAQVRHVAEGVDELLFRQGTAAPVGEAGAFVQVAAGDLLDQVDVAHALAEAADHGGDLGVEDRRRDESGLRIDDLDVLAGGVEDLDDARVRHQPVEGRKIDAGRQRIDDRLLAGAGELDQAEVGPERLLAHELGIDGDVVAGGKPGAGFGEGGSRGNDVHCGTYIDAGRATVASSLPVTPHFS